MVLVELRLISVEARWTFGVGREPSINTYLAKSDKVLQCTSPPLPFAAACCVTLTPPGSQPVLFVTVVQTPGGWSAFDKRP